MPSDLLDSLPAADPAETRRAARDAIEPTRGRLLGAVLRYIEKRGPMGATDEEVCRALDIRISTGTARRCELRDCGDVVASPRRRPTESGRSAVVWIAARFAQPGAAESIDPRGIGPNGAGGPDLDGRNLDTRRPATIESKPSAANRDTADGWPARAVAPGEPCPRCNSLAVWWDAIGGEHCQQCERDALARSIRLANLADRARPLLCRSPTKPAAAIFPSDAGPTLHTT